MNKQLLLGSALLIAVSAISQTTKQVQPTGITDRFASKIYPVENQSQNFTVPFINPSLVAKKSPPMKTAGTASLSAASWISGSHNVFGMLVSAGKPLQYNKDLNAISFVHRASVTYVQGIPNGNSGTIAAWLSTNKGGSWDSTAIWENATNLARYPQGGIYNPASNTNLSNAYVIGTGPITGGSGWLGNWYCSKQLNAFNKTAGADQQSKLNASATSALNKHHFSRVAFQATGDGLVRSMSEIMDNPDGTTLAAQNFRGAGMVKGTFNAGAFVWTMDSIIPAAMVAPSTAAAGYANLKYVTSQPYMAWNEAGTVGYVMFYGVPSVTTTAATKGFQPIVYKTTTSGSSWSLLPTNDYTTPKFQRLVNSLWPVVSNTALIVPFFTSGEGTDLTVDVNDNLHIATSVIGHYSANDDSLAYSFVFGANQYAWQQVNLGWPTIYDFHTTAAGSWDGILVDTMGTEGPSGGTNAAAPGHTANPWVDASSANNKMYLDARIQIGRSHNGRQIFYSWTESDTLATSHHWNIYPDIKVRSWDVTTNKMTKRYNVTGGVTKADQTAYYHYMSNKPIEINACGSYEMPFTITYNNAKDGGIPVEHYYLKGFTIPCQDYTVASVPLGIEQKDSKTTTANYDVNVYPNPASDIATVSVVLKEAKAFEIRIYNTVGQLINTIKIKGVEGANDIDLDLTKLNAGVYMYSVQVDNAVITKKLIKE